MIVGPHAKTIWEMVGSWC